MSSKTWVLRSDSVQPYPDPESGPELDPSQTLYPTYPGPYPSRIYLTYQNPCPFPARINRTGNFRWGGTPIIATLRLVLKEVLCNAPVARSKAADRGVEQNDAWDPFFSKVNDILEAAETKAPAQPKVTGGGQGGPHADGPGSPQTSHGSNIGEQRVKTYIATESCTTTGGGKCTSVTTFDPTQPTNACSAWSSLSVYCGGAGTNCACYSSSYYVPDQWNSLAAACAKAVTGYPRPTSVSTPTSTRPRTFAPAQTLVPPPTVPPPPTYIPPPRVISVPIFAPPPTLPRLPPRQAPTATSTAFGLDFVLRASSYASYCPTNTSTVAFGAVKPTPQITTSSRLPGSAATVIGVPMFKVLVAALFLILI